MKKQENIVWHAGHLTGAQREIHLEQKGAVLWLTGLSGSGKSTVAHAVELALVQSGHHAYVLDGDNIRHGLNSDLAFSPTDRAENIRRIGEVAKLFCEANVFCITAFISPYRADRDHVRALLPKERFIEVYCAATLAQCESRDVKGLYAKARRGEIPEMTGLSAPYEPPERPELSLLTGGEESLQQSTQKVLEFLKVKNWSSLL